MWKQQIYAKYRRIIQSTFGKHLFATNVISTGGLLFVGDAIQQKQELARGIHMKNKFDWNRSGRMFLVGLSQGPPHHYWYVWLDRFLPGHTLAVVAKKILMDQVFAAPFFAFTFIYGASLLEGRTLSQCWVEFKQKFPTIYLFDWCIWPPSQFINFKLVPEPFRVIYVNVVTVIWDVFLSYIKHEEASIEQLKHEEASIEQFKHEEAPIKKVKLIAEENYVDSLK